MNWYKTSSDSSRVLVIMRSPSGAGKSTLAQELGEGGVVFSTDDFFEQGGEYKFNPAQLGTAHRWNHSRVKQALDRSISPVVVDNTNVTLKEILPYLELAKNHGYEVRYASPNWNEQLITENGKWNYDFLVKQQQNKDRTGKGKIVPDNAIKRQIDRFEYQLPEETDDEFSRRIFERFNK